jgi:non-ribosomal peptide synthetase component F
MMDTVGNRAAKKEIAMIKVAAPTMALKSSIGQSGARRRRRGDDFPLAAAYAAARTLRLPTVPTKCTASRSENWNWRVTGPRPRMSDRHFKFWPAHSARTLSAPATNLFYNCEVSARRYPEALPGVLRHRGELRQLFAEAGLIAGFLEQECGVRKGDRVLLLTQNSPQFVIAYYGILRANAVVVPLNPMNLTHEIARYAEDAAAKTIIVSQELYSRVEPLLRNSSLQTAIVAAYSSFSRSGRLRAGLHRRRALQLAGPGVTLWRDVLAAGLNPAPSSRDRTICA